MGETFFWGKRKCHWRREIRTASNKQNWRKHCKSLSNCAWKSSADCQEHSRASEHQQRNSYENLKILTWGRCVQKWSQRSSPKNKSKEEFLANKQTTVLEHPAYSPDLACSDFFLFPKIKEILKGRCVDDIDNIRQLWRLFHKTGSKIVLKGGLVAGIGA